MVKRKYLNVLIWVFLGIPAPVKADLFQWVDSRGTIHFTDNLEAVPQSLRDSPNLIVRRDSGPLEESETPPISLEEPLAEPEPPREIPPVPKSEAEAKEPVTIHYNHQTFNVVVIHSVASRPPKRAGCPHGCRGAFRPSFEDRRFIHPSAFDSVLQQSHKPSRR